MRLNIEILKAQKGVLLPNFIKDTKMTRQPTFNETGFTRPKNINYLGKIIKAQVNIPASEAKKIDKVFPTIERFTDNFIAKGYTPKQSSGIVGNIFFESGLNPSINQHGGGPGFGIAQWEKGNPRYLKLNQLAKSTKVPITDEGLQMKFLNIEMTSPDRFYKENSWGGRGRDKEFLKSKTVDDSAAAFSKLFLRPGKPHLEQRTKYSNYIYNKLNE